MPRDTPLLRYLQALHADLAALDGGAVADYIPALASADPATFGISIVTVNGTRYSVGDSDHAFTIQSVSKPFVYGMALTDRGVDDVRHRVGVEPTSDAFNSIRVDEESNRPFNPLVNTGAIVTTGLVRGDTEAAQWQRIVDGFESFTGRTLEVDEVVYASEAATGDRNRAIAYLMRNLGMLEGDPEAILRLYFRQCSLLVTTDDLAVAAATLAAGGRNPVTGRRALDERLNERILSIMQTCGMYDAAGAWAVDVGFPSKSGVSGAVVAVLPGQAGVAVYSPPLDGRGNSLRGIEVCRRLAGDFGLHPHRDRGHPAGVIRGAYRGGRARSTQTRTAAEYACIEAHGDDLTVVEVQGLIRFAETEFLVGFVVDDPTRSRIVVLDGRRALLVDDHLLPMFAELADLLAASGRTLVLAGFDAPGIPSGFDRLATSFAQVDDAVEWWEDDVLANHFPDSASDAARPVTEQELLHGLAGDDLDAVLGALSYGVLEPGAHLAREGKPADAVFLLLSGQVSVRLGTPSTPGSARVAAFGGGVAVGELALLEGGVRSASLVADTRVEFATLTVEDFSRISAERPTVRAVVMGNLARSLALRLRRANDRIRVLDR